MPKLEYQAVLKEVEQGLFWPVYWLYGSEKWKLRELLTRIQAAVPHPPLLGSETFDAEEVDVAELIDQAQSLVLGGGTRVIVVRDAHLLKNGEGLVKLLGPRAPVTALDSICIFLSKDLDGRKKLTKVLLEQAAVVSCEEVFESQRESWVHQFAHARGMQLSPSIVGLLCSLESWSLDLLEQELEKLELAQTETVLCGAGTHFVPDIWIDHLLNRDVKSALPLVHLFANEAQVALPLLGLLGWNVRNLGGWLLDQEKGTRDTKINPYLVSRFQSWAQKWSLRELLQFQEELADLDFNLKQTPLLPLGVWTSLVWKAASDRN